MHASILITGQSRCDCVVSRKALKVRPQTSHPHLKGHPLYIQIYKTYLTFTVRLAAAVQEHCDTQ